MTDGLGDYFLSILIGILIAGVVLYIIGVHGAGAVLMAASASAAASFIFFTQEGLRRLREELDDEE